MQKSSAPEHSLQTNWRGALAYFINRETNLSPSRFHLKIKNKKHLLTRRTQKYLIRTFNRLSTLPAALPHYSSFFCAPRLSILMKLRMTQYICLRLIFTKGPQVQKHVLVRIHSRIFTSKRSHTKNYSEDRLECRTTLSSETTCLAKLHVVFRSQDRDRVQVRENMRMYNVQNAGKNVQIPLHIQLTRLRALLLMYLAPSVDMETPTSLESGNDMMQHVSISRRGTPFAHSASTLYYSTI